MPIGATLRNAYRARKGDRDREDALKVPQSFTFMQRQGWSFILERFKSFQIYLTHLCQSMPSILYPIPRTGMPGQGHGIQFEENLPRRLRCDGDARDVFAMVKLTMSDDILCQPPLLVYPHAMLNSTERFFNSLNERGAVLTQQLEETRAEELNELASALDTDFPHLYRGANYLRLLTNPDRPRENCCRLNFIAAGSRASLGYQNVCLGRPPLPPKPHKLQVVFHHRPR